MRAQDYVDREREQATLHEMIAGTLEPRTLVISDGPGTGKTSLLKRLRHNCIEEDVPVAYVNLRLHADAFSVVMDLRWAFSDLHAFAKFDRAAARVDQVIDVRDMGGLPAGAALVNMTDADMVNGVVAAKIEGLYSGTNYVFQQSGPKQVPSDDQKRVAMENSLREFISDLAEAGSISGPLVVLLDHLNSCDQSVRDWADQKLVRGGHGWALLQNGGVLVVATTTEDVSRQYSLLQGQRRLLAVQGLAPLREEHVVGLLRCHGLHDPSPQEIQILYAVGQERNWLPAALARTIALLRDLRGY